MRRVILCLAMIVFIGAAAAVSGPQAPRRDLDLQQEERAPLSATPLNNAADSFQFAIVSDRTGGHRASVFAQAVQHLNLLQPEFVVTVGDLIEGYSENAPQVAGEWREFQSYVQQLQMPFFYLPGNHDLANAYMNKVWREKFGRRYYHFVYRDVLFLMVNSEENQEKEHGQLSVEQLEYLRKALEENKSVRWTFVFLHRPMWTAPDVDTNGWSALEKLLTGREYSVFAGHLHVYRRFVRSGMNYFQLATTGGASRMRGVNYGEFDHFVWVTMKPSGPIIANILMDGVYREDMSRPLAAEPPGPSYASKPVHPTSGRVLLQGQPVAGAYVVFKEPGGKKNAVQADAITETDGSFKLSTYGPFDGAPPGEYEVTIIQPKPFHNDAGGFGPNQLPERYAGAGALLKANIKPGVNHFNFELQP